jgi:hypothetical protein
MSAKRTKALAELEASRLEVIERLRALEAAIERLSPRSPMAAEAKALLPGLREMLRLTERPFE